MGSCVGRGFRQLWRPLHTLQMYGTSGQAPHHSYQYINHRYTQKVALSIIDNDQYGEGSPPALETDERHDDGTDCDGAGASDTGTEMEELVPRLPARPRLAGRNSAFGGPARNRVVTGGETPYSSETESSCAAPRGTTKGASCMPRREAHEEREEDLPLDERFNLVVHLRRKNKLL